MIDIAPILLSNLPNMWYTNNISSNAKSIYLKLQGEIIKSLKNKMSNSDDDVPSHIIKITGPAIVEPLTYIVNLSLRTGIFPDRLKIDLAKPLYKKGDPTKFENYRPISLLSGFSKIFEKWMCNRVNSFLLEDKLYSQCQHAYTKGKSTQTAIFQFITQIVEAFEHNEVALGIFLDLSKAYDRVNYEI